MRVARSKPGAKLAVVIVRSRIRLVHAGPMFGTEDIANILVSEWVWNSTIRDRPAKMTPHLQE